MLDTIDDPAEEVYKSYKNHMVECDIRQTPKRQLKYYTIISIIVYNLVFGANQHAVN